MVGLLIVAGQIATGWAEWSACGSVVATDFARIVAWHGGLALGGLWCLDRYRDRRAVSVLLAAASLFAIAVVIQNA